MEYSHRGKKTRSKKYYENTILNAPNIITSFRVPFGIMAVYALFAGLPKFSVLTFFIIGALTDFIDGQVARGFKLVTKFGEKFDVMSDRMFTLLVVAPLLIYYFNDTTTVLFIFMILSREIISLPGVIYRAYKKRQTCIANMIGKVQTALQFTTLGLLILEVSWLIYPVIITFLWGTYSGLHYLFEDTSC